MDSFSFEWDEKKALANQGKHGVSFGEAQKGKKIYEQTQKGKIHQRTNW